MVLYGVAMNAIAEAVERDLYWNTEFITAESVQVEMMNEFKPADEQLVEWRLFRHYGEDAMKIRERRDLTPLAELMLEDTLTPIRPQPRRETAFNND